RLLSWQYQNAIADVLGPDAAAATTPLSDVSLNGFDTVGSASLSLGSSDIEALEQNAFAAAQVAVHGSAPQAWRVCQSSAFDDDGCARAILAAVGKELYRRGLADDELARWDGVWSSAAQAYGDFDMGLEFALAGMLQSPSFVYLVEIGRDDQGARDRQLTGVELASRLSFFLAGTTPSDDLISAAENGELDDATGVRLHAQELLASGRAQDALHHFFDEKLGLTSALPTVERPDADLTDAVRGDMRAESLAFVDDVVWTRNADARELYSGAYTFLNDELAGFYGMPLPGSGAALVKVPLDPSTHRAGLLTQGAFLARFAHEHRSSPTLRGKYVRESVLCQAVPAPPMNVNTTLPEPTASDVPETTRDRMAQHMDTSTTCYGFHSMMDPLGFALEEFDQVGRFRTHEYGLPINSATTVDGVPVADAIGLESALHDSDDAPVCLVKNLFRQATGHIESDSEEASLDSIGDEFQNGGYRLQDALVAIAASDGFRRVALPEGAP
ncbi:MAG TPA: DUF1588 domain-containing protein, partial [Myxococcota bacterium]